MCKQSSRAFYPRSQSPTGGAVEVLMWIHEEKRRSIISFTNSTLGLYFLVTDAGLSGGAPHHAG
jgi:hypothetical protein